MKILAAVDFSDMTNTIVDVIPTVAHKDEDEIFLVHMAEPDPDFVGYEAGPQSVRDQVAKRFQKEHQQIQDLAGRLRERGYEATGLLIQGPTAETIQDEAKSIEAQMIIIGSHGHGALYNLVVGSVTEAVLKEPPCPVLVVPVLD